MDLIRRLLGGVGRPTPDPRPSPDVAPAVDPDPAERAYELDLLRSEQERLDDLRERQLRYADYAWRPPAQGGTRRADDESSPEPS